jgi:hypothetical protein
MVLPRKIGVLAESTALFSPEKSKAPGVNQGIYLKLK